MFFLILGEKATFGINGSFSALEKNLVLILLKQRQNFGWVYITIVIIVAFLQMEKESTNLNLVIKKTFHLNFV